MTSLLITKTKTADQFSNAVRLQLKRSLCNQCHRPQVVCLCHTLSHIENHWPIHILQHPNETKHAIGTAKIAQLSLSKCKVYVSKSFTTNHGFSHLIENTNPLLVYPGEQSTPVENFIATEPRPLIFLDGSWRKTRRMIYETPELQALPKVSFTPNRPSRYRIRKEPNEQAVSTLEAIVAVLSELENSYDMYQPLLKTMDWMINKQIELMGKKIYEKNYLSDK